MSTSKTFLLIHGAWEGAWAWKETTEFLERKGNKVISIDLPGHGNDKTHISEINLDLYVNRVKMELNKFYDPVVLVAHSFAGYVVSKVAEEVPKKIEKLIFIASAVPYKGKPAIKIFEEDKESEFIANLIFSEDQSIATMNRETIKNIVFGGASDAQIDEVIPQLVAQATKPFFEIVETTEQNFGSVPKAYIETKHDRVLSLTAQRMLQKETGITESILLDTGHVPLVTTPEELAYALMSLS